MQSNKKHIFEFLDMFIRKDHLAETLVVNVIFATTQLLNCKSLEWSKLVDKDDKRTLNVICLSQEELGSELSHLLTLISGKNMFGVCSC